MLQRNGTLLHALLSTRAMLSLRMQPLEGRNQVHQEAVQTVYVGVDEGLWGGERACESVGDDTSDDRRPCGRLPTGRERDEGSAQRRRFDPDRIFEGRRSRAPRDNTRHVRDHGQGTPR